MPAFVVVICCVAGAIALTAAVGLISAAGQISREAGDRIVEPLYKRIWNVFTRG